MWLGVLSNCDLEGSILSYGCDSQVCCAFSNALSNFFRGNMFGLVDYEDEEDDMPMNVGGNGKDRGEVFEKVADSLLTSLPLTDTIWTNLEDATVAKRPSSPAPELERKDAVVLKRQKSGKGQGTELSTNKNNMTSIDDSVGFAPSMTGAQALGSIEEMKRSSQLSTSTGSPASRSDGAKIFPYENSTSSQLPGNGIAINHQTCDPDSYPATEPKHVGGGDSSSKDAHTPETVSCSNGKLNVVQQRTDCLKMLAELVGKTANGAANAPTDKISGRESEVLTSPGLHEGQHLHNGTSTSTITTDRNGGENQAEPEGTVHNLTAERCTSENGSVDFLGQESNGTTTEGVERVEHGSCPVKGNIATSGVTQQLNNGSLDSESKKLTSLGSDLIRAVTPTSPGYSVR
jgi:hypothetical protein